MIITISRQYATNGILIGRLVAEKLGYRVYDREMVEAMARDLHVNPSTINHLYESMTDPVQSMLLEWLSSISKETYVRYLKKALTHIAAENNAVIVGRGANFVFGASSLNVRIVAPQDLRIAIFRAGNEMTKEEARRTIIARDRDRVNFVRNVFHSDIDNPQYYDLIVNLSAFTPESAAELIANAAKERCKLKQDECTEATLANHVRMMIHAKHHVRPEIVERYS